MACEFINENLPAEVLSKLASFRESGIFCDVILEADSSSNAMSEPTAPTSIRAHKNVLAAVSPYFSYAQFCDSLQRYAFKWELYGVQGDPCSCGCENHSVIVFDIDGKTLRVLVDYMYVGRLDIDENNVRALFGAAKILQLDCIRNECLRYFKEHLSISNWMEIAAFAKAHNCPELDGAAVSFARHHFWELVESEELMSMDETSFLHFISDDRLNPKDAVFEAVINWVKHDSSRQASLPNVLVGVRLPLTSRKFLLDRVYNEPMIQESSACMVVIGKIFHDMLSQEKTSRVPENWYRRRQILPFKMILIAGGVTECGLFLADVNIYDPYSQQWTPAAPLLRPRCAFGMATVGDSVYAVGGSGNSGFLRSVEIYDAHRNSWRAGQEMQYWHYAPGVTALNGTIFVVGWCGGQISRAVEMLDPRQGKWISLPSMTNARTHIGLAAANGLLYAVGGISGGETLNSVEVYDPRACRWTTAAPMLKKRYVAGATAFRDQIVVVGGFDENGLVLSSAEMLTDDGWMFLPEMSQSRQNLGAVDVDGSLFAFGGRNDEDYLSSIEYLDFDSSQWRMSQVEMPQKNVYFGITLLP